MSDATLAIVLTALPPTMVALAGLIVSVVNSLKANKIHVLVNSNMSKVQADLAGANQRIEKLQTIITKMVDTQTAGAALSADVPAEKGT
jgi:hypothetical protein